MSSPTLERGAPAALHRAPRLARSRRSEPSRSSSPPRHRLDKHGTVLDASIVHQPLFLLPNGSHWRTADVASLAQRFALLAGLDGSSAGARSFRIKLASDLHATMGSAGERLLKERGRWHSDVFHIYSRTTARSQLEASAALGRAAGVTLEGLGSGYIQPARR